MDKLFGTTESNELLPAGARQVFKDYGHEPKAVRQGRLFTIARSKGQAKLQLAGVGYYATDKNTRVIVPGGRMDSIRHWMSLGTVVATPMLSNHYAVFHNGAWQILGVFEDGIFIPEV